jgi:uncharacterized membrane protein
MWTRVVVRIPKPMREGDLAAMEAGAMSWLGVIGLVVTVICAVEGIVRLVRKDRRWGVVLLGLAMAFGVFTAVLEME